MTGGTVQFFWGWTLDRVVHRTGLAYQILPFLRIFLIVLNLNSDVFWSIMVWLMLRSDRKQSECSMRPCSHWPWKHHRMETASIQRPPLTYGVVNTRHGALRTAVAGLHGKRFRRLLHFFCCFRHEPRPIHFNSGRKSHQDTRGSPVNVKIKATLQLTNASANSW